MERGEVSGPEVVVDELNQILQIDLDAVETYREAIPACAELALQEQLRAFLHDHERHIEALGAEIRRRGGEPRKRADLKGLLQRGFTKIAGLIGTEACLRAMLNNERLVCTLYERHCARPLPGELRSFLEHCREEERRHYAWFETLVRQRLWDETVSPQPA